MGGVLETVDAIGAVEETTSNRLKVPWTRIGTVKLKRGIIGGVVLGSSETVSGLCSLSGLCLAVLNSTWSPETQ